MDPKKYSLVILVTPYNLCVPYGVLELHFVPMIAALGFGLANHPDDYEYIYDEIDEAMSQIGVLPCYKRYCTIDVKEDEEFCAMLVDDLNEELVFYSAPARPSRNMWAHPAFVRLQPSLVLTTEN